MPDIPGLSEAEREWLFGDPEEALAMAATPTAEMPAPLSEGARRERAIQRLRERGGLERGRGARIVEGAAGGDPDIRTAAPATRDRDATTPGDPAPGPATTPASEGELAPSQPTPPAPAAPRASAWRLARRRVGEGGGDRVPGPLPPPPAGPPPAGTPSAPAARDREADGPATPPASEPPP